MTRKSAHTTFKNIKTIITYDLSPCEISSQDICEQDKRFHDFISFEDNGSYELPYTTLRTKLNRKDAIEAFKNAVKKASDGNETITRLFVVEVDGKNGFIENNE